MEELRIERLKNAAKNWNTFYECSEVKNRGWRDSLSEEIADWLKDRCSAFFDTDAVQSYVRSNYNFSSKHRRQAVEFLQTDQHNPEDNIEYALFIRSQGCAEEALKVSLGDIGFIIDHQVPLQDDKGLCAIKYGGEIDLLSYSQKTNDLYILELKEPNNDESVLKCIIEAYTYFRRIGNIAEFKDQFNVPQSANIVIAPLFFEGSPQHDGYLSLKEGGHHRLDLFEMINKDMQSRLGDDRCKVAFARINMRHRFTPHDLLENMTISVTPIVDL